VDGKRKDQIGGVMETPPVEKLFPSAMLNPEFEISFLQGKKAKGD
jgi:hypothetical protein